MADQYEVGSPDWWLRRLHGKLTALRDPLNTLDRYYTGDQPLRYASSKFREAFGGALDHLSDNWCGIVVDAVEERLNLQGFRIPIDPPAGPAPEGEGAPDLVAAGQEADTDAWTIWQRNDLDAGSQMAHNAALVGGYANLLVWPDAAGLAVITPEAPEETLVETVPGNRRQRAAAIKSWTDDWTGKVFANVYLPDGIYKFVSRQRQVTAGSRVQWEQRPVAGEDWPVRNRLGVVPMVTIANRQRLRDAADSEIRQTMALQDMVNKMVADMLVASEFQAFRQRWATGLEVPADPNTGVPVEPFRAAVDRLWISDSGDTTFGEFAQADLRIFVAAIEMFVQHIATQSRTPPHYFYLAGTFPSGESIKSAETGLVAKTRRRMTHFSDPWEEAMRLAFAVEDDPRKDVFTSQVIWADPESRSEGEHVDALVKLGTLGVPNEVLWERGGFSPQEIARMRAMVAAEADAAAARAPVLALAGTPAAGSSDMMAPGAG